MISGILANIVAIAGLYLYYSKENTSALITCAIITFVLGSVVPYFMHFKIQLISWTTIIAAILGLIVNGFAGLCAGICIEQILVSVLGIIMALFSK